MDIFRARELADMATELDTAKNKYPDAERAMAELIVDRLHEQAMAEAGDRLTEVYRPEDPPKNGGDADMRVGD